MSEFEELNIKVDQLFKKVAELELILKKALPEYYSKFTKMQ